MSKVAFIGLGVMGYPMAGHIRTKGGHDLTVYNRTPGKAQAWVAEFGGQVALTPEEAAKDADFVFCCVGNDDDLRQVTDGRAGRLPRPQTRRGLYRQHDRLRQHRPRASRRRLGPLRAFLEPQFRRPGRRENGVLTVMVGGDPEPFAKAEPVIAYYARAVKLLGPSGAGQLTKMVNQICIAGLVQGLSEAIHFAQKAGLDVAAVMETISKGAAQSWQMENRWKTMSEGKFDFGFAVDWMRKDLAICLDEARRNGAHLPVSAVVDQFYSEVQAMGGRRWDTSSLIARLNRK